MQEIIYALTFRSQVDHTLSDLRLSSSALSNGIAATMPCTHAHRHLHLNVSLEPKVSRKDAAPVPRVLRAAQARALHIRVRHRPQGAGEQRASQPRQARDLGVLGAPAAGLERGQGVCARHAVDAVHRAPRHELAAGTAQHTGGVVRGDFTTHKKPIQN